MNTCREHRERLGEWLMDALLPAESDAIAAHVASCVACRREVDALRALDRELAAELGTRSPAKFSRSRIWIGAAAASLFFLGIAIVYRSGESKFPGISLDGAILRPGSRVVTEAEPVRLDVGTGGTLDIRPHSAVRVGDGASVHLESGGAHCDIHHQSFDLITSAGRVAADDAQFDVHFGDPLMSQKAVVVGSAAVVTVAVITGTVFFFWGNEGAREPVGPGEGLRKSAAGDEAPTRVDLAELTSAKARAESLAADLSKSRGEQDALRRRIAELETKYKASEAARERLASEVSKESVSKSERIAKVMAGIEKLKENGMGAMVAPGAMAALLADLRELGPEGTHFLSNLLTHEDDMVRFAAAKLLEDLSDPESISALRDTALNDKSELVARMASHGLALMNHPGAKDALVEIAEKTKDIGARINAMYGLVALGDQRGFDGCLAILRDPEGNLQMKAALASGFLAMKDPKTLALYDASAELFKNEAGIMSLAVPYLRNLNVPEARARLQNIANNTELPESVRNAALEALR